MSGYIIPDEWLIHDLVGENGEEARDATINFLGDVIRKCDKLVIVRNSPFSSKILSMLAKNEETIIRRIWVYFRRQFIENSRKCVILKGGEPIGTDLLKKIPPSDQYLFEARQALGEGVIVTTDSDISDLPGVRLRADFLAEYPSPRRNP